MTIGSYADNTGGGEGINVPLSAQRGEWSPPGCPRSCRRSLPPWVGSVNPIASNAIPEGAPRNRRVEIVANKENPTGFCDPVVVLPAGVPWGARLLPG